MEPGSRVLLSPQLLLMALPQPFTGLLSVCESAKNAESVGRTCLRNDHISGVVFPISPP